MQIFKSKIDKWVALCFLLSVIACLLGTSVMLKIGGTFNIVLAVTILLLGAGFPLWIMVSTQYRVNDEALKIVSGPFSWHIPIQSILSVQAIRNSENSPALSLDRLEIKYDSDKVIYISPADETLFMEQLNQAKSGHTGESESQQTSAKKSDKNSRKTKKRKDL